MARLAYGTVLTRERIRITNVSRPSRVLAAALAASVALPMSASAVDLEVTHWWTSGGEAAAVAEFAKAFNEKTDHNWVDGAIAGGGGTARPIMVSRILNFWILPVTVIGKPSTNLT